MPRRQNVRFSGSSGPRGRSTMRHGRGAQVFVFTMTMIIRMGMAVIMVMGGFLLLCIATSKGKTNCGTKD